MEYHHLGISYFATDAIRPISSIQPTFELDLESPTFTFVQKRFILYEPIHGDESIISKTVTEKAKFSLLFYRLLLSTRCTDILSNQVEITLGNLSESFLAQLSTGHFEDLRIFSNAFSTYHKEHLQ